MRVLKNYKKLKEQIEEFPAVKILDAEDVFVELPLCVMDFGLEIEKPYIYAGPDAQVPIVLTKEELLERIKGTKVFYLKQLENGNIQEVPKEEATLSYRLPEDTPVDKLAIMNGQLGIIESAERGDN